MSESDCEYEEITVLLDFVDLHPNAFQMLINSNPTCSILGIEGEQPMLQIGSSTFSGEYQDSTTTFVAFGDTPNKEVIDQTEKLLVCSRASLEPKPVTDTVVNKPS